MIDDGVTGGLRWIGRFLVSICIELLGFYTGEVVKYLLTFGRLKPRWDYYDGESPAKFVLLTELSTWIGYATWLLLAVVVTRLLG